MAQMDLSPVPDPRLQKPVLPLAQGAPTTPEQQPVAPVSMPTATVPAMPEAGAAAPAEKLNKVPLAFPQLGQQSETQNQQTLRQTQKRGSGISNIHNPILKTLATIGDVVAGTFAPRAEQLIPGTEGNYALHLARAGNAVKGEEEQQMAPVERGLKVAQTHHAEAQAESLPKELASKTLNTAEGIMQWNPETRRYDIPAGTAPEKPESAGKTITTDQGIMQWNPQTNRYDINAGNAPDKAAAGTVHQLDDGSLIIAHSDGTATPITMNGQPVKGKSTQPAGDDFAQFYQKWMKEKGQPDNATNEKKARAEWSASGQAPERPPQALMLVPGDNGNFNAQVVRPGSTVASGAMTAPGVSRENATPVQMLNREGQARIIRTAGDQLIASIEQNRDKIGNLGSYWQQYTNGTPISDPATAGLMAQLASFAALQPTLHGFRSEAALKGFENIIGGVPKNPDALVAAIKAIQGTAGIIENGGGRRNEPGGGATAQTGGLPEVSTQAQYDALPKGSFFMQGGEKRKKP